MTKMMFGVAVAAAFVSLSIPTAGFAITRSECAVKVCGQARCSRSNNVSQMIDDCMYKGLKAQPAADKPRKKKN